MQASHFAWELNNNPSSENKVFSTLIILHMGDCRGAMTASDEFIQEKLIWRGELRRRHKELASILR